MEYQVKAFPTFLFFVSGEKRDEIRGADANALKQKIDELKSEIFRAFGGEGQTLGAQSATAKPVDPREARLRALGGGGGIGATAAASSSASSEANQSQTGACDMAEVKQLKSSLQDMGFDLNIIEKAMSATGCSGLEGAIDWIERYQNTGEGEADVVMQNNAEQTATTSGAAESEDSGVQNQSSANDTSSASNEQRNLSPEEKKKLAEELIKKKRQEKAEREKKEEIEREKQRRQQGKEITQAKESFEDKQRRRMIEEREKEKREKLREREQIRKQLAQDKLEKLAEQYGGVDKIPEEQRQAVMEQIHGAPTAVAGRKSKLAEGSPEERIKKAVDITKQYRAGGDGLRALKILKVLISNPLKNPGESKYEKVNLENEKIKTRIAALKGPLTVLEAVGFQRQTEENMMVLNREETSNERMEYAVNQIESAIKELS